MYLEIYSIGPPASKNKCLTSFVSKTYSIKEFWVIFLVALDDTKVCLCYKILIFECSTW